MASCLQAANQEICAKRIERDQATTEKEQLKEALTHLLEEELARAKLSKEYLVDQRCESIFELVKAGAKADEAKAQSQATIQESKTTLEGWKQRCYDIADAAEEFVKIAWLANQALMDIPRSLRIAEGMVDPFRTPREISQFLELCRELYDTMKEMSAPP
ncbi:hypothetical protein CR513_27911, partial [Mucuna pruriens]